MRPQLDPSRGTGGVQRRRRRPIAFKLGLALAVLVLVSGSAASLRAARSLLLPATPEPASRTVLTGTQPSPDPVYNSISGDVTATALPALQASPPGPDTRLLVALRALVAGTRARVGVAVVDQSGPQPRRTELNAGATFVAASTYKFVALMANAERIAAGSMRPGDRLCYRSSQAEAGWFNDYKAGACYTRQTLASRAGLYSDNTAGHMLVDGLGGGRALNAYAASRGASHSTFYYPNQTTAGDLASLWTAEAQERAGGEAAKRWLYPLLTKTAFEKGIPAGVPASVRVVHKVGWLDSTVNDAALVIAPRGSYVLAVTTEGLGGDAGWALVARISATVWKYEAG